MADLAPIYYLIIVFELPDKAMLAAATAAMSRVCLPQGRISAFYKLVLFFGKMPAKTIDSGGGCPSLPPGHLSLYISPQIKFLFSKTFL